MEAQFTDFESAAYVVFIVLTAMAIQESKLNFYMPLSKVDENMQRAHARGAVRTQRFWFRRNITDNGAADVVELSVNEILNGSQQLKFPGVLNVVRDHLRLLSTRVAGDCSDQLGIVDRYLTLISRRASGTLMTNAAWIRQFVTTHAEYKHDSVVSEHIAYDLLKRVNAIAKGDVSEPDLFADLRRPIDLATIRQRRPCDT